jgi:hypothetical protein
LEQSSSNPHYYYYYYYYDDEDDEDKNHHHHHQQQQQQPSLQEQIPSWEAYNTSARQEFSPDFMETESSLPRSQQPAADLHEPAQSSRRSPVLFL